MKSIVLLAALALAACSIPYRAVGEVYDPASGAVIARFVTDGNDVLIEGQVAGRGAIENKDDNAVVAQAKWTGGKRLAYRRTGGVFGRTFEKVENPDEVTARLYPAGVPAPAPATP